MKRIPVDLGKPGVSSMISLPTPLSSLLGDGVEHGWGRSTRIWPLPDGRLKADIPEDEPAQILLALTDIQTGLLYAAVSGLRPDPHAPDGELPALSRIAGRVGLNGSDGRRATLALWDSGVTREQAVRVAADADHAHLVLVRGARRGLPRMSVLVRQEEAERCLEEITRLGALRADPPQLQIAPDPAEEAALLARNEALLASARARARRTLYRSGLRPRLGPPVSGWERAFLPALSAGSTLSPPGLDLDRMAVELCDSLRLGSDPDLARKRILRVLNRAWRLGEGTDPGDARRPRNPQPGVLDFFRDRARAVEEVTREEGSGTALRALTRVSALQAWRFGHVHPRRSPVPPAPRFREELPVIARALRPEARKALLEAQINGARPEGSVLAELVEAGLIEEEGGAGLTRAGLALTAELTGPPDMSRPSLLDLLEPTPEALRALEPDDRRVRMGRPRGTRVAGRSRSPELDPGLLEELTCRSETAGSAPDAAALRRLLRDLMGRAWRLGRDSGDALPNGRNVRLPGPIRLFIDERARLIAVMTLEGRKAGRADHALDLIRDAVVDAWRIGSGPAPDEPPPPRFLEESPPPLRGLSPEARNALLSVGAEAPTRPGKRALAELMRAGLLSGTTPAILTPEGEEAVRVERAHQASGLPSIRKGASRD